MSNNDLPYHAIMFVCLGNICRSPTAEGVLRHLAKERGVDHVLHIESSAMGAWNLGETPDRRSVQAAKKRGIDLSGRAKLFKSTDFQRFDYILGADLAIVEQLIKDTSSKPEQDKIHLITYWGCKHPNLSIPDPYNAGPQGFEQVLDVIQDACQGILDHLYPS